MCLDRVDEVLDEPDMEERVGYKVMWWDACNGKWVTPITNIWYGEGVWHRASKEWPRDWCDWGVYPVGFHVYAGLKHACDSWLLHDGKRVVVRVRYRGVLARGREDSVPVVVAREMKIVEEVPRAGA